MKIMEKISWILVNTPFYPHWLSGIKSESGDKIIGSMLFGDVLEVGAGDGSRKNKYMKKYPQVKNYTATDYDSWDEEFNKIISKDNKFSKIKNIILGYNDTRDIDVVCSATDLPFDSNSFCCHVSFEVLEHIDDPYNYFSEAVRVVRSNGFIMLSVPFMFRMHGGEPDHKMDYLRYLNGFFFEMERRLNLKLERIYCNTGIGTSLAEMINSWLILKIREGRLMSKLILILLAPIIFFISNIVGLSLDISPDKRFATRYYVIYRKVL